MLHWFCFINIIVVGDENNDDIDKDANNYYPRGTSSTIVFDK